MDDASPILDEPAGPVRAAPAADLAPESPRVNRLWSYFNEHQSLTFARHGVFKPETNVFTMGSCFAADVRYCLKEHDYEVFPNFGALDFDPARQKIASLPEWENLHYYHTHAIRQEVEKAFGLWQQADDDYWLVDNGLIQEPLFEKPVYQDPYRRLVFGSRLDDVRDVTAKLDRLFRDGIADADVYIFTLGLIEVWRKTDNGLFACMNPGYGGGGGVGETEFVKSGFQDNYENMRRTLELIFERYPDRQVALTVSPVPLGSTFTDNDVFVANMESKSTLRAGATQLTVEFDRVHYFPSYEICQMTNPFEADGRHVRSEIVAMITSNFLRMFTAPDET